MYVFNVFPSLVPCKTWREVHEGSGTFRTVTGWRRSRPGKYSRVRKRSFTEALIIRPCKLALSAVRNSDYETCTTRTITPCISQMQTVLLNLYSSNASDAICNPRFQTTYYPILWQISKNLVCLNNAFYQIGPFISHTPHRNRLLLEGEAAGMVYPSCIFSRRRQAESQVSR